YGSRGRAGLTPLSTDDRPKSGAGAPRLRRFTSALAAAAVAGGLAGSALAIGTASPGGVVGEALRADLSRQAAVDADVAAFYAARGFRPLWIGRGGVRAEAAQLVDLLAKADRDGLRPSDYGPERLRALIAAAQ